MVSNQLIHALATLASEQYSLILSNPKQNFPLTRKYPETIAKIISPSKVT
jgi:hypothetical protein